MIEIALGALLVVASPSAEERTAGSQAKLLVTMRHEGLVGVQMMIWADESRTLAITVPFEHQELPAAVSENYDSWRRSSSTPPGNADLIGILAIGEDEITDDQNLVGAVGLLSGHAWSIANVGPPDSGQIERSRITFRWYERGQPEPLVSYTTNIAFCCPIRPGNPQYIFAPDGFWNFLNFELPEHVDASVRIFEVVGALPEHVGAIIAGPHNAGSSTQYLWNRTTGELIDLGSSDANLAVYVRSSPTRACRLVFPHGEARHLPTSFEFSWTAPSGTMVPVYTLRIADNPALENPIHVSPPLLQNAYLVPSGVLSECSEYFWGVTASTLGGSVNSMPFSRSFFTMVPADFNGDGQVDFFDYLDFVAAFAAEDPGADFNGDGQIDFFDYLDFIERHAQGC